MAQKEYSSEKTVAGWGIFCWDFFYWDFFDCCDCNRLCIFHFWDADIVPWHQHSLGYHDALHDAFGYHDALDAFGYHDALDAFGYHDAFWRHC